MKPISLTLWALSGHGYISLKPWAGSCLLKSYPRLYNSRSREGGGGLVQHGPEQAGLYNLKGHFWRPLPFSTSEACYISFFKSGGNKLPFKTPGAPKQAKFYVHWKSSICLVRNAWGVAPFGSAELPFLSLCFSQGTVISRRWPLRRRFPMIHLNILKWSLCFSSHGVYRYVLSHWPVVVTWQLSYGREYIREGFCTNIWSCFSAQRVWPSLSGSRRCGEGQPAIVLLRAWYPDFPAALTTEPFSWDAPGLKGHQSSVGIFWKCVCQDEDRILASGTCISLSLVCRRLLFFGTIV